MRLDTFHQFALAVLSNAPDVQSAAPWDRGAEHLRGIQVTLATGANFWIGLTAAAAPGDKGEGPEIPVEGEPPTEAGYPQLLVDGKATPGRAVQYFAAAIANSGNRQIAQSAAYGDEAQHPGFHVIFHNQAHVFCLLHHTARAGQALGGRAFELQSAV